MVKLKTNFTGGTVLHSKKKSCFFVKLLAEISVKESYSIINQSRASSDMIFSGKTNRFLKINSLLLKKKEVSFYSII